MNQTYIARGAQQAIVVKFADTPKEKEKRKLERQVSVMFLLICNIIYEILVEKCSSPVTRTLFGRRRRYHCIGYLAVNKT